MADLVRRSGAAIEVDGLVKSYGGRRVVDELSFSVGRGELFALLGPNGAGKSTTVEILEGYRRPDGGRISVLGLDPIRDGGRLKPRVGLMLQLGGVYGLARPLEILRLFASFYAEPRGPEELLGQVGLEGALETPFRRLSGGQKQRLLLALALIGRPELLFLDEPTAAMDPQARQATWELIGQLKREGATILLTTHFMDEAERLADRVAIVDRGKLVALDTPRALVEGSAGGRPVMRFRTRPGLALEPLSASLGGAPVQEVAPGEYIAQLAPSPALIAALSGALVGQEALLTDLQVGFRSLEDVFLHLTGRELRD
jgi:ABC-2 type transport system ATP-binding protein